MPVAGMEAVSNMKIVPTSTSASVCQGGGQGGGGQEVEQHRGQD